MQFFYQLFNDEEAVKRSKISNGYNAVGISYDNIESKSSSKGDYEKSSGYEPIVKDTQPSEGVDENEEDSSDDEPYVPNPELELPQSIIAPPSMKQAAVIEKTAYFVAKQGPQMEIVLKTKQANNPSFAFLTMGNQYNPYFKFVLKQIKMGRYHPQLQMLSHVSRNRENKRGAYKEEEKKPSNLNLPKVNVTGTSYAKLINQFKKFNKNPNNDDKDSTRSVSSPMTAEVSSEPNSRPESRGMTGAMESDKQNRQSTASTLESLDNEAASAYYYTATDRPELPEGPVPDQVKDPEGYARYYERWQAYYHWYYQYYNYTETGGQTQEPKSEYCASDKQTDKSDQSTKTKENAQASQTGTGTSATITKAPEVQSSCEPPDTLRPIIDKMAEYVARNGTDFEAMVRVKNDTRFQFLDSSHPCHAYYQKRRREAELAIAASQAKRIIEEKRRQLREELASETQCTASETKATLSKESSAEKYNSNGNEMETDDDIKKSQQASISFQLKKESYVQKPVPLAEDEDDDYKSKDDETSIKAHGSQGDHAEQCQYIEEKEEGEISPTADDCVDEVERKLANKLAAAAREKLARVNRESVMQAERKKRAAAFMAKVRATEIGSSLASRIEKKRRAEEEREKEKERERAAVALEIANRSREKALPAAYSVVGPRVKPVESTCSRPVNNLRTRSPEVFRRSHHHRRDRDRERDRDRGRDRDRDSRRRSRSRSRERRDHHHRSGGHSRRHNERR